MNTFATGSLMRHVCADRRLAASPPLAAVAGVSHRLVESFQLEPSSQFGVVISDRRNGDVSGEHATHYIMHYTFSHEYSLEGIPQIDSRAGAWGFDKREYSRGLPRHLRRPPYCALESTQVLWSLLHEGMAAHDTPSEASTLALPAATAAGGGRKLCAGCTGGGQAWPNSSATLVELIRHDKVVRARVEKLVVAGPAAGAGHDGAPAPVAAAASLIGTGPWRWVDEKAPPMARGEGAFFFLRGGQLHTPWGSAAWGASDGASDAHDARGDQILLYLCGREKWTHSVRLVQVDGTGGGGAGGDLRQVQLRITARNSGEVQIGRLGPAAAVPPPAWEAASAAAAAREVALIVTEAALTADASGASPPADLAAATLGEEDPAQGVDADAAAVRRRLLGTGPWRLNGGLGTVYFLAHGVAHIDGLPGEPPYPRAVGVRAQWRAHVDSAHGASVLLQYRPPDGDGKQLRTAVLRLRCWHLEEVLGSGAGLKQSGGAAPAQADLVWSRPASRCFPTCSDQTHPLTAHESTSSPLAQRAMQRGAAPRSWTWAGIPGMRFVYSSSEGGGVLVTPWGHGSWGIVPSRGDVLVAEFAQKRHMLLFDSAHDRFLSTRCDDGEIVQGGLQ